MGVTTRDIPDLARETTAPETPSKSSRSAASVIYVCLDDFCRHFDIDLPFRDEASPSKQARTLEYEIVKKFRFCFFLDHEALGRKVLELRACRPPIRISDRKLEVLDLELGDLVMTMKQQPTPKSARRYPPPSLSRRLSPQKTYNAENEEAAEAPPSPTLAVKHAPKDDLTHSAEIVLSEPLAGVTSAKTSFATTSFMSDSTRLNRSFMSDTTRLNQSFMSDGTKLSQSTAATSVYSAPVASSSTPKSEFPMSSFEPGIASQLETDAQARLGAPASEISPSKVQAQHYRIANIPSDGLAQLHLPRSFLSSLPMDLRVEAYRVMRACGLSSAAFEGYSRYIRSLSTLHDLVQKLGTKKHFHRGRSTDFSDSTLCAKLRWSEARSGPLFDLELHPPRQEDLNSFQRKWGADRILVVDLPLFSKPPSGLPRHAIEERFREMLAQPQTFLGRTWEQFLIQDKKRKKSNDIDSTEPGAFQACFFAVSGDDIPTTTIAEFLEWFIPYGLNANQPARKAFARLDLGASRSKPALTFTVEQTRYNLPDKLASLTLEQDPYADPSLIDPCFDRFDANIVMNDGCSEISVDAMDKARTELGLPLIPAVMQARFFGGKGVWYRGSGEVNHDPAAVQISIDVAKSQIKAKHILHDDHELLTFNVVNYSRPARPSVLYPGFLPILVARGVPVQAVLDLARREMKLQTAEFFAALNNALSMQSWIHSQKDLLDQRYRKNGIWGEGGFPVTHEERILQMLDGGFEIDQCLFLAEETLRVAEQAFSLQAKRFKIPLGQSTSLIGIADPTDSLEPGEVHIGFSTPFKDLATGQLWSTLHGKLILVARNPSMRDSDIRKWKVVYNPKLGHLVDVIIFSVKGRRPGASMLSGGDYDGDTFWVTWEPTLVTPFLNAPAPWELPPIEHFGITKDTVKLGEIAPVPQSPQEGWNVERARNWIRHSTAARMDFNMLGIVTLTHGSLTYADDDISSVKANRLVDLHDYLVDGDKQGYLYTTEAWLDYKRQLGIPAGLPKPAYRVFTSHDETEPDALDLSKSSRRSRNVVDQLYFGVVQPEVDAAIAKAKEAVKGAGIHDSELVASFDQALASVAQKSVIWTELKSLKSKLEPIRQLWKEGMRKYHATGKRPTDWHDCVAKCRVAYVAIRPTITDNDSMVEWLRTRGNGMTIWEEMKASALAKFEAGGSGRMMFSIAGDELCRLKAQAAPKEEGTRTMRMRMFLPLKPHKRKTALEVEADGDSGADTETDESEFHDRESLFDEYEASKPPTPQSRKRKSSPVLESAKRMQPDTPNTTTEQSADARPVHSDDCEFMDEHAWRKPKTAKARVHKW